MNDNMNASVPGPRDTTRINLSESADIDYWTKKFGVSEHDLRGAIQAVGYSPEKVEAKLLRH